VLGGSFNTVIGLIFLAIVIVSPGGLMGLWDRLWNRGEHRPGSRRQAAAAGAAGTQT
jgi:uncharacterized membrane protein